MNLDASTTRPQPQARPAPSGGTICFSRRYPAHVHGSPSSQSAAAVTTPEAAFPPGIAALRGCWAWHNIC